MPGVNQGRTLSRSGQKSGWNRGKHRTLLVYNKKTVLKCLNLIPCGTISLNEKERMKM
jgi:hypothetical protein